MQPIGDFDHAVTLAKSFTRHIRPARPITVKVLYLSLKEAQAMGFAPDDLFRNLAPAEDAELRQLVVDGVFTVDQARDVAREHLRSMRMGIDPRDVKRKDEAMAITLRQVADAFFARPGMLKESTRSEMDRHIKTVFDKWQSRPIISITPEECRKRYEEIANRGLNGKKAAPGSASFAFTVLRTLINWAKDEYQTLDGKPIIEKNPVVILKQEMAKQAGKVRTRHIDRRQIGAFWSLLTTARRSYAKAISDVLTTTRQLQ